MVDADAGTRVGRVVSGQEHGVNIRAHLRAPSRDRRYVQFHTHPGSSSFSDADAALLVSWPAIHAMVVVGVDGAWYALSRKAAIAATNLEVVEAYWGERNVVDAEFAGWTLRERSHMVWVRIAERLGLRYDQCTEGRAMTPEERRARAEYVVRMAEQGVIAEPPEDRAEWRRQFARPSKAARTAPNRSERKKGSTRPTA